MTNLSITIQALMCGAQIAALLIAAIVLIWKRRTVNENKNKTMIKIQIKNRWTGSIIFEHSKRNNTMAETVKEYIRQEIEEKNKTDTNLTGADLTGADLTDTNLARTNLTGADLTDTNLARTNLTDTNLTGANLTGADLTGADLTGANLTGANLADANLAGANLLRFKSDLWRVLLENKTEIEGLKTAIKEGKIDGSKYEGDCACLKGTIHNLKACSWADSELVQNVSEPSEQWFLQISKGMTPENNSVVRLTLEWIQEFEDRLL